MAERPTCGAMSKRTGQPCRSTVLFPNGRCQVHGGPTPHGAQLPQYKTGRYSKYLPPHLIDDYAVAQADPELLSHRGDLGLLELRVGELLGKLSDGRGRWEEARAAFGAVQAAWKASGIGMGAALARLALALEGEEREDVVWAEIRDTLENRRKLADSERKRLWELNQHLTTEQALTLIAALQEAVRAHVDDPDTLASIGTEFQRLANGAGTARLIGPKRGG